MKPSRTPLSALALLAVAPLAAAADWSDTWLGYSYGTRFKQPGSDEDVAKHVATLQYVGGWRYGVNFFNVDMLKSDEANPANGPDGRSKRGAQEVYVTFQHTLSLGKLSGSAWSFGPVRDVGLQLGFDFNSQNDAFGSGLVKWIGGPKLEFDVPGLLTLGLLAYKEQNNNAIVGRNVDFDVAPRLATVWRFDVGLGAPAVFKGWATWTGPKGRNGFGGDTAAETWLETALVWDLGAMAGRPKTWYGGLGYQYIRHKFGNLSSLPGTRVSAPSLKLEAHF